MLWVVVYIVMSTSSMVNVWVRVIGCMCEVICLFRRLLMIVVVVKVVISG